MAAQYPVAKVNFDDFKELVAEVESHRAARLLDFDQFMAKRAEPGVVVLDTRSKFRYDRIHLEGAKHLNFADFTEENLKGIVPSYSTTILIYCNNNFDGDPIDFATKMVVDPRALGNRPQVGGSLVANQIRAQAKPRMMALNIPTYVNLYGYGYRNVYELHELVDVTDNRVVFEGTLQQGQ